MVCGRPRADHGMSHASLERVPYATNADLPERIRKNLPRKAQDIFRAAFNSAYDRYGPKNEARAFRIAWAAVKRGYVQRIAGVWVPRPNRGIRRTTGLRGSLTMRSSAERG